MTEVLNPYSLLKSAGQGDADSLRLLAREGAQNGILEHCPISIVEGLVFARLAFAASGDPADGGALVSLLAIAADAFADDVEYRTSLMAEAIALTSKLADMGVHIAEDGLPELVEKATAEEVAMSHKITELMKEEQV